MSEEIAEAYWRRVNRYLKLLQIVPNLRMLAVCNNLAFGDVDKGSDIDIFIVARRGRLFIVRFFCTLLIHLMGVRRYGNKVSGRFCLSFFVDDSHLNLQPIAIEHDVYLARWIAKMLPVIDDGVSEDFLRANLWINELLKKEVAGISRERVFRKNYLLISLRNLLLYTFDLIFGFPVEYLLKTWQLKRARLKASCAGVESSLIVEDNILKFHNVDRRAYYRDLWGGR